MKAIRAFEALNGELAAIVGDGRSAAEIGDVVRELYERLDQLDLPDIPSDEIRWRIADQVTRSTLHITRDGRLVVGLHDVVD